VRRLKLSQLNSFGWMLVFVCLIPRAGWSISINRTNTWNGGGLDLLWSNSNNWDSGAPLSGDSLEFSGSSAHPNNDLSDIYISNIDFTSNAGPFFLEGNKVTFSGGSDLKTIKNDSSETQTISFSGDLIGLQYIHANAGTLVFNSTISTPGAGLDILGGANVVFNNPLVSLNRISVSANTTAQFNGSVSSSIDVNHATAIINADTSLPGASISDSGNLKLSSDVQINGHLDLVNEGFFYSTAPTINTNGFDLDVMDGIRDGVNTSFDILPAQLIKTGSGILTVFGDNSVNGWSGGTTIQEGTLKAGSSTAFNSSSASFTLANTAGATLDLNGNSFTFSDLNGGGTNGGNVLLGTGTLTLAGVTSSRFDGQISGEGSLVKNGDGVLWLTGTNSYSGTTTVNAGILKGNGDGLQGNIVNNASVVFDQTGSGTYGGDLSGTGTLEKTGEGTLTLTSANSFSGATTLTAGTLAIGNSGALGTGSLTINGGTLKGNGTPRTIQVGGDYSQNGGILKLTLYGSGAGQQDQLNVLGNATLGGLLNMVVDPNFLPVGTSTYAVVTANSLTGLFDFNPTGASLAFQLDYSPTSAVLTAIKTPYSNFAQTPHQQIVADYMDSLYSSATGDLGLVMGELNALPAADLANAIKSVSPQTYQTIATMDSTLMSGFSQRIHGQLARSRLGKGGVQTSGFDQSQSRSRWGALTAEAGMPDYGFEDDPFFVPEKKWGIFMTGDGQYTTTPKDGDVQSGSVISGGITTGVDYRFTPQWTLGFGLGYAQSNGTTGDDDIDIDGKSLTPGIYGSFNQERYYVDGLVVLQNSDYTSKRHVVYGTHDTIAEASPKSQSIGLGVEAGVPFRVGTWDLVPVGGFQTSQETVNAFDESGAGAVSLSVSKQKRDSFASQVGVPVTTNINQRSAGPP
jgi:autotransporter-associated beta strand protein